MPDVRPRRPARLMRAYDNALERARQEREIAASVPPPLPVLDTRTVADKTANTPRRSQHRRRKTFLLRAIVTVMAAALIVFGLAIALWRSPSRPAAWPPSGGRPMPAGISPAVALSKPASVDEPTPSSSEAAKAATVSKVTSAESRPERTSGASVSSGFAWTSPRLNKIDVRPTWRAAAIGIEDPQLVKDLQQAVSELWINRVASNHDAIFAGAGRAADAAAVAALKGALKKDGVLWLFYRKGAPLAQQVTAATAAAGLVRLKTVAFSSTYDAAAFVDSPRRSR